jgi:phage terminase large subunit-like protein
MITSNLHNPSPEYVKATVTRYCQGVESGAIVAGRLVRYAVSRHLRDLDEAADRGLFFDEMAGSQAVQFFPLCLRHSIGEWAGQPFTLEPWQQFIVWSLFGWKRLETNTRRFRKAYITLARKNGKTTFAAGLALKALFFDDPIEQAAQLFCVATKEDQAVLLWSEASLMVQQCPWFAKRARLRKSPRSIELPSTNSYFKPLGSDSTGTDGLNPHAIIMDELHAWREQHRPLKEKLSTGGGARRQPLEIIITTAGDNDSLLWQEEEDYASKALEAAITGNVFDDSYFAFCATVDVEDDPLDPATWPKANPNYGVSVKAEYLEGQARRARNQASYHNQFVRYHANKKTESREREISVEMWAAGAKPLTVQPGAECHGGIDLSRSNDWSAISLCFPIQEVDSDGNEFTRWELLTRSWTCADGGFTVTHEPFASWIREGHLICHRGNAIDLQEIEDTIAEWSERYNVKTWAYDKQFAREMAMRLKDNHGLSMFEFTQAPKYYNEPFRKFTQHLGAGLISHGNDPVLEWQAGNLQNAPNSRDEWFPDKSIKKNKIDAMVASLMAFSECLFNAPKQTSGPVFIY